MLRVSKTSEYQKHCHLEQANEIRDRSRIVGWDAQQGGFRDVKRPSKGGVRMYAGVRENMEVAFLWLRFQDIRKQPLNSATLRGWEWACQSNKRKRTHVFRRQMWACFVRPVRSLSSFLKPWARQMTFFVFLELRRPLGYSGTQQSQV